MAIENPPVRNAFAEPEDPTIAKKLPKYVITKEWIGWFGQLILGIDKAPSLQAKARLSGQTASIAATALAVPIVAPGLYQIAYTFRVTTPATTGAATSSLLFTLSWTEGGVAQTLSGSAETGNTTTTRQGEVLVIRADSATPISYATTYASDTAAEMVYSLDVSAQLIAAD